MKQENLLMEGEGSEGPQLEEVHVLKLWWSSKPTREPKLEVTNGHWD